MPMTSSCSRCGSPFSGAALEGLCPSCVGRLVLLPETPAVQGITGPAGTRLRYFGDYELLEEIARGGMGVVYKARQLGLNRIVAVKMILAGQLASGKDVQRFRTEAEAAASLQHPNIVVIHEIGDHEGQHYFSMDYVQGKNLAQISGECGIRNAEWCKRAARYVKTVAEAIQHAHECGTLHRDLKPSNILIDAHDQPRVTDFGLARLAKHDSDLTLSGQILGTPNFMSPEQASGKPKAIGVPSDVYSLGAILYFLLTGKPPFAGDTMHETLTQVLTRDPASPRKVNPSIPRDLETICLKCLEKQQQRRYGSAKELANELDHFLRDEPILARPTGPVEKGWRWAKRHKALAGAISSFSVAAILFLALGRPGITGSAAHLPPVPSRCGGGISAVIDGKIYVTMPSIGDGGEIHLFYAYDTAQRAWSHELEATPIVHERPYGGANGGKFYVAGGFRNGGPTPQLDIYNPRTDSWSQGTPMRLARGGGGSAFLDGKLYAVGGKGGPQLTNLLSSVEIYDPATDKWADGPEMHGARMDFSVAVVKDVLYAVGGRDAEGHCLGTLEALRPDGTWIRLEPMRQPAFWTSVAARNGIIYVVGGDLGATPGEATASLQAYDVATDRWSLLTPMPEPRFNGCGAHWVNKELIVIGGWTYGEQALPHDDMFIYHPDRNVWIR